MNRFRFTGLLAKSHEDHSENLPVLKRFSKDTSSYRKKCHKLITSLKFRRLAPFLSASVYRSLRIHLDNLRIDLKCLMWSLGPALPMDDILIEVFSFMSRKELLFSMHFVNRKFCAIINGTFQSWPRYRFSKLVMVCRMPFVISSWSFSF